MQSINNKSHYATLISSLNKEYLNAKLGKTLKPNNLYILDIVYNLLNLSLGVGISRFLNKSERKFFKLILIINVNAI